MLRKAISGQSPKSAALICKLQVPAGCPGRAENEATRAEMENNRSKRSRETRGTAQRIREKGNKPGMGALETGGIGSWYRVVFLTLWFLDGD